ncbi:MAG: hypothetical protein WCP54_02415 [Actinomycetes bacterium]
MINLAKNSHKPRAIREGLNRIIAKGSLTFVFLIFLAGLVVNFVIAAITALAELKSGESYLQRLASEMWINVNFTFLGGSGPDHFWARVFIPITAIIAIGVTAIIFAYTTNKLSDYLAELRKGKSPISFDGHILILGWSNRIYSVIRELDTANRNQKDPYIVVFANIDRTEMESSLEANLGDIKHTKILTREGDPTNIHELTRANAPGSRSIIILDASTDSDATVISTILAIQAIDKTSLVPIVAEMDSDLYSEALEESLERSISIVRSNQLITRVTAQSTRAAGLTPVLLDLLDFDGDEIYFGDAQELVGHTYRDALTGFSEAAVIGVRTSEGKILVNPLGDTVIGEGDSVIAIAQDDDRIIFAGLAPELDSIKNQQRQIASHTSRDPERILVLGWSHMGENVINEMLPFLPANSTLHIIADSKIADISGLTGDPFPGLAVTYSEAPKTVGQLADSVSGKKYDEVMILAYREGVSAHDADSRTLATILAMNRLFAVEDNGVEPTRLIAELLDSKNLPLAKVASADDLVMSDNLAALLIAQLSENAALKPIFDDLFDIGGATINIYPIERYVPLGQEVSFMELVAHACAFGESAVGYRIDLDHREDAQAGVKLNPTKNVRFTAASGDGLIVVGPAQI